MFENNLRGGLQGTVWQRLLLVCVTWTACSEAEPRRSASEQLSRTESDAGPADERPDAAMPTSADAGERARPELEWRPLAADERYHGKGLAEWAAEWVRWSYAQTSCEDPTYDEDGSRCGLYNDPSSPVFFLATGERGTMRTRCVVPADKAVLVPLAVISWDNAGAPERSRLTDAELEEQVRKAVESLTATYLRIDGHDVGELAAYSVGPHKLEYVVPPEPNWFSCNGLPDFSGKVDLSFVGGGFVLLPPPKSGSKHVLEYGGVLYVKGLKNVNEVTTTLTVE